MARLRAVIHSSYTAGTPDQQDGEITERHITRGSLLSIRRIRWTGDTAIGTAYATAIIASPVTTMVLPLSQSPGLVDRARQLTR
jgi:hypothetical protein